MLDTCLGTNTADRKMDNRFLFNDPKNPSTWRGMT